jgi:hypothetical protein
MHPSTSRKVTHTLYSLTTNVIHPLSSNHGTLSYHSLPKNHPIQGSYMPRAAHPCMGRVQPGCP